MGLLIAADSRHAARQLHFFTVTLLLTSLSRRRRTDCSTGSSGPSHLPYPPATPLLPPAACHCRHDAA